jgi:ATP-binding cassette subfamily B multidrug efflux pump
MKRLFCYLKDYKKESVLGPLFKLFEALLDLIVPLIMAQIIDVGINQNGGDIPYIVWMCFLMVAIGIFGLVSSITAQYFAAKASVGFATKIRTAVFSHIQKLSFTELDTIGTSTMITRLTSDINQVQTAVNIALRLLLRSPFIVAGAIILAFTIDFNSAIVFIGVTILLAAVTFGIMLTGIPMYKKVQSWLDKVLLHTRENLTGVRVIRALGREDDEIKQFDSDNQSLMKMQMFVSRFASLLNPLTYVIVNAGIVVLLYSGAIKIDSGYLTQGALIALINYMSQILVELVKFANMIISMTKGFACAARVADILDIAPSMSDSAKSLPEPVGDEAIKFNNVSLAYFRSGESSLKDISFSIRRGQTLGVIGGTGSGKTSLVHLIPRFYDATKGAVEIFGVPVRDYPISALREKIAIVMQKAVLFRGTIRENLLWGNENATDEQLMNAIRAAQATDIIERKEHGLDEMIEQGGKNLSGGQKQRLSIARALVKNPEILILDDSASALDFATDAALRKSIRELEDKMTVVIVSQRASSIQHADLILVLDDGELVGSGAHSELLESCEVYKEIYESQYKKAEEL